MSSNTAKYEVLNKQHLISVLDIMKKRPKLSRQFLLHNKKYAFIYFASTQRNVSFLIISDTVYLSLLCRHQLAAHEKKLGGWGGLITTVGCRYFRNFTVSFRNTQKHLKVIGSRAWSPEALTIFSSCTKLFLDPGP